MGSLRIRKRIPRKVITAIWARTMVEMVPGSGRRRPRDERMGMISQMRRPIPMQTTRLPTPATQATVSNWAVAAEIPR